MNANADHASPYHASAGDPRAERALRGRTPGAGLPGVLYTAPEALAMDLRSVWHDRWLVVGFSADAPRPGDHWLVDLPAAADTPAAALVIVRGDDGRLRALHNACRHRGSRLLDAPGAGARRLVCPYHQWAYRLDGALLACPGFADGELDRDAHALPAAHCREVAGLALVHLGERPGPLEEAADAIDAQLGPSVLAGARVAARRSWEVAANWKLIVENNRECLHCHGAHREYTRATWDVDRDLGRRQQGQRRAVDQLRRRLEAAGLPTRGLGLTSAMTGRWFRANRTPLADGFTSETLDGAPAAPPMGRYARAGLRDAGVARVTAWPSFWCHASADHAAATILLPTGPATTRVTVTWLVDRRAGEGDVDTAALTALWTRTSEQDWALCERQQRGVASLGYRPGPLSARERGVAQFHDWYASCALPGPERATGQPPGL